MTALLKEADMEPIIDAVKNAFTGKTGRVVPVSTRTAAVSTFTAAMSAETLDRMLDILYESIQAVTEQDT